jgi:hypothetical protein
MRNYLVSVFAVAIVTLVASFSAVSAGQLPLSPARESGSSVSPVFEGWFQNQDGTFTLSFGYFNRNGEEVLDIPIGANNFIEPGDINQGQPTHFLTSRHWGVFTVTVPADFGDQQAVWTLISGGETIAIPGRLHVDYEIEVLKDAASGNVPPSITFDPGSPAVQGPTGATIGPRAIAVGTPLTLSVSGRDDLVRRPTDIPFGPADRPAITMTWVKHQGPGQVTFSEPMVAINSASGETTTTAMFSAPGDYLLRVTANDYSGIRRAGNAQCCWTNGFVRVRVTE